MKKRILIVLAILVLFSLTILAACQEDCQHEYTAKWDENNHWQECKLCNDKKDEAPHDLKWVSIDVLNHWQECSCGYKTAPAAHADGNDADTLCDDCGRDLHSHAYDTIKSDALSHWNECSCGDKQTAAPHEDVKNNETQAEGADGKCDVCGHEIYAVNFNMQGHGEAVATQNIGKGGNAVAPEVPADVDAWKFGGWYKEAACENEFDFAAEVINETTVIYAKWTEDTTPGASKAHAFVLALGEDSLQSIAKDQVVYFVYTAQTNNRYTISLTSGLKCTFTTDKTEGTCDAENPDVNLDLKRDEKVYIALTCAEELDEGSKASVMIGVCTDEPMPADVFPSGEYSDGSASYVFEFNHDSKTITDVSLEWNETVKYVGGSINQLSFIHEMDISGTVYKTEYTLKANEEGDYTLTIKSSGSYSTVTLNYVVSQDPIPVSKFGGVYAPKENGMIADRITEIGIYADGSGYLVQNGFKNEQEYGIFYNEKRNTLVWGQYSITLNLDGETVVGINISGGNISGKIEYARTNKVLVPKTLPLTSKEYAGGDLLISKDDYSNGFRWGSSYEGTPLVIEAYDEENDIYTVKNGNTVYKLKIEENTIKLYNAEGDTLVATLIAFVPVFHDAPSSGVAQTINAVDFQKGYYWYKITKTGWYTIVVSGEQTVVYCGLDENDPTQSWNATTAGDRAIKLDANTIIGVYVGDYEEAPASVSFTLTETEAPAGMSEDNPIVLVNGKAVLENMDSENTYYFRYSGIKAGTYIIGCTYESYGTTSSVHYVINEQEYGYSNSTWLFYGGVTSDFPYAVITIETETDLLIAVDNIGAWGNNDVTVAVMNDYRVGATSITEDSGSLEAGTYKLADLTGVASLVLTTDDGDVTLTANQLQFGFKLDSSASYVVNYALGSEKNPVKVTGIGTTEVDAGKYVMITAPADKDVILMLGDLYGMQFCFTYDDEDYGYSSPDEWNFYPLDKTTLSIAAGESVTVKVFCNGYPYEDVIPVIVTEDYIKNASKVELVKGTPADDKLVASATITASGTYCIETTIGAGVKVTGSAAFTITMLPFGTEIVATESEGVYTAIISAGTNIYFSVTLADGQTLSLSAEYAKGSQGYPKEVELVDGEAEVELAIRQNVYIVLPAGTYKFTKSGTYMGASLLLNDEEINFGVAITIKAGDVLLLMGGRSAETITITEIDEEPDVPPVSDNSVTYSGVDTETNRAVYLTIDESFFTSDETTVTARFIAKDSQDPNPNETLVNVVVTITKSGNSYSFSYLDYGEDTSVTFTVEEDGTIKWVDSWYNDPQNGGSAYTVLHKQA